MKTKTPSSIVSTRFSLRLAPAVAFAALIACCPIQTRANTIALSFTTHIVNLLGVGPANTTVGWSFSLSSAVSVTDLGAFDGSFTDFGNGTGDGLAESHVVTIWDSLGVQILAQATVPFGAGATLSNGFRYVTLGSSVLLGPGNYVIGMFDPSGADVVAAQANGITTAAGVSYMGGRSVAGSGFPSGDILFQPNSYFGPNFQFTAVPTNGVPDSGSTWTLLLLGLTATCGLKFLVRQPA